MKHNCNFKLFGMLGLLACGASSTLAQQCPTDPLDLYINSFTAPGNGCIQGAQNNVENYGFTFETRSSSGNSDVASSITVTPNNAAATLGFSGFESLAAGGGDIEYFIGYNIDPPPILTGDSISIDPFNPGTATLNLYVCQGDTPFFLGDNDGTFECGSTFGGFSGGTSPINLADPNASVNSTTPNATFGFPPTSQVGILLELVLEAGDTGTGSGNFGSNPSVQGTAPEPASFLLVGLALAAAIGFRKLIQNRLRAR
jgi:hypothetical protein